ncbi:MAG: hypothetical protein LBD08_08085 [Treponema sp.]|jgi:hypothetical protein|nr:hypothetical protein [Treponema sp.]
MAQRPYRWLPGRRTAILNMAKTWLAEIPTRGQPWNIPAADIQELTALTAAAETALTKALSGERSSIITAECEQAFGALIVKMQYLKERFFLTPPLADADYPALLLHSRDHTPTPVARPDAIPDVHFSFPAPGQAESTHRGPLNGRASTDPRADEKVCSAFGFIGEGGGGPFIKLSEIPAAGAELPNRIITKRKKHHFDLGQYRGMKMYVSYCYMNSKNEEGPWSPVFEFTVP